jgi:hypothetical protein
MDRSRANRAALILPSLPRSPKPGPTRMALTPSSQGEGSARSKSSASTHSTRTRVRFAMPPCVSASAMLL